MTAETQRLRGLSGESDLPSTRSQTFPYGGGSAATISSPRRDGVPRRPVHPPRARTLEWPPPCASISIYVCIYTCIDIYMHIHLHGNRYVHMSTAAGITDAFNNNNCQLMRSLARVYVYEHTNRHCYTWTWTYIYICVHIHIHIHIHVYTVHMDIYIYTYMYVYACVCIYL